MIASEDFIKKNNIEPKAKVLSYSSIAIDPGKTFESTIAGIESVLKKRELSVEDIDLFEISEAFASQVILTKRKLQIPDEKLNIFGGDIAFGHPLGAAGARILVTLINAFAEEQLKEGIGLCELWRGRSGRHYC